MNKLKMLVVALVAITMLVGTNVSAATKNYGFTIKPGENITTYVRVKTNPAEVKPLESWQHSFGRYLRVYQGDKYSPLCFDGLAEDYDGSCVKYNAPTLAFQLKMQRLRVLKYSSYSNR